MQQEKECFFLFLPTAKYHWSKAMLHLLPDIGCSPMAVLFACDRLMHKHFVRSLFGCVFFIPYFFVFHTLFCVSSVPGQNKKRADVGNAQLDF